MRVRVGYQFEDYGTIAATPDGSGFELAGNKEGLQNAIDGFASGEDPAEAPGGRAGFLKYMIRSMNNGYWWVAPDDDEARRAVGM